MPFVVPTKSGFFNIDRCLALIDQLETNTDQVKTRLFHRLGMRALWIMKGRHTKIK